MLATSYLLISIIPVIGQYYLCLAAPVIMCYFPSTARERTNIAKFEIKNINFTLCTHYIYASAKIDNISKTLVANDPAAETGPNGLYREFVDAKNNFTSIKMLLSVGGRGTDVYNQFAAVGESNATRGGFVTSAVNLLRQYGFDGLDVDWPTSDNRSKAAHASLLEDLRVKFSEDTQDRLILTSRAPGIEMYIDGGYDVVSMARLLDYVILSTNDLYFSNVALAQFPCPLFSSRTDDPYNTLSANYSIHAWHSRGMPFNKMVVGLTGLGRIGVLADRKNYKPWGPVTSESYFGHLFKIFLGSTYIETCESIGLSQKYFDDIQKCPYIIMIGVWIGYDDSNSITLKVEHVIKLGVAGTMFASLDYDDFHGTFCGEGKFPLLVAVKNATMTFMPHEYISNTTVFDNDTDTEGTNNTSNATDNYSNATSPAGGGGADINVTYKNGTDNIMRARVLTDTTEKKSNILRNLLYGFLIILIPIVCLATIYLCGRMPQHVGASNSFKQTSE